MQGRSCLLLTSVSPPASDLLTECSQFLESSTNPFILVTPGRLHETFDDNAAAAFHLQLTLSLGKRIYPEGGRGRSTVRHPEIIMSPVPALAVASLLDMLFVPEAYPEGSPVVSLSL